MSGIISIETQVQVLKRAFENLNITFDSEEEKIDFTLDIVNEYKKEMSKL